MQCLSLVGKQRATFVTRFWSGENRMGVGAGQCGCSMWGHKVRGKEDREWKASSVTGLTGL